MINPLKTCAKRAIKTSVPSASAFAGLPADEESKRFVTGEVQMRDLKVEELSHVYGAGGKGGCGGKGGSKGGSKGKSRSHKSKSHKSKSHKSKCH
jgi:hypothetical protein